MGQKSPGNQMKLQGIGPLNSQVAPGNRPGPKTILVSKQPVFRGGVDSFIAYLLIISQLRYKATFSNNGSQLMCEFSLFFVFVANLLLMPPAGGSRQ